MTAPLRFIIEVKRRTIRSGWKVLTEAGTLEWDRARAWVIAGKAEAEAALARSRPLAPKALWRLAQHQDAPRLPLARQP
jgi:hypothetical protein